jgi:nucleoid-associated protein YgaU
MDTTRAPAPAITLAVLLAAEIAAIVALHELGSLGWARIDVSAPGAWLSTAPSEDVILATARLAGLACAYWLFVTTLASSAVAAFRNAPSVVRAVARTTPQAIRVLAERAAVATVAGGAVLVSLPGLSAAAPPPPGVTPPGVVAPQAGTVQESPDDGLPGPAHSLTPKPPGDVLPVPGRSAEEALPASDGFSTASAPGQYVVVTGDNLWRIAETTVADRAGTEPSRRDVGEIAAYWLQLIEANRDVLRSGDPDLIFPGERIVLPD